jgi:XapX domain-containing protein
MMNPLIISLGAGVLVGLFYALLRVRSPAPPAIALVGLLGMIIGGQIMAHVKPQPQASTVITHVDKVG